jgi:hypothetical protein
MTKRYPTQTQKEENSEPWFDEIDA